MFLQIFFCFFVLSTAYVAHNNPCDKNTDFIRHTKSATIETLDEYTVDGKKVYSCMPRIGITNENAHMTTHYQIRVNGKRIEKFLGERPSFMKSKGHSHIHLDCDVDRNVWQLRTKDGKMMDLKSVTCDVKMTE